CETNRQKCNANSRRPRLAVGEVGMRAGLGGGGAPDKDSDTKGRVSELWYQHGSQIAQRGDLMTIAALVLPVFAVIVAGWIAGASGYLPASLSGPLVQFAYNVAMPALVFITIAEESL